MLIQTIQDICQAFIEEQSVILFIMPVELIIILYIEVHETYSVKGDIESQLFGVHEVKAGFEIRKHNIKRNAYSVDFYKLKNFQTSLTINDVSI